mgnify:CR=1 FL=1
MGVGIKFKGSGNSNVPNSGTNSENEKWSGIAGVADDQGSGSASWWDNVGIAFYTVEDANNAVGGIGNQPTEKVRLSSRGYFGIGSSSPTEELHVQGDMRLTGAYYDRLNSAGTAGQILSSTATGTEWIPAPYGSGADDDWILNSANNSIWNNHPTYSKVGIGPFFSNANPPQSRLHVDGRLLITGGGNQWSKVDVDFNTGGYTFFEIRDGNSTSDFRFTTGGNNGSIDHSFINGNGNLSLIHI